MKQKTKQAVMQLKHTMNKVISNTRTLKMEVKTANHKVNI